LPNALQKAISTKNRQRTFQEVWILKKWPPWWKTVEFAYDVLSSLKIPNYDVLVDITGGQKVPTVAGAAVALADGRHFQYVSTHDYQVRTYDVTYLP